MMERTIAMLGLSLLAALAEAATLTPQQALDKGWVEFATTDQYRMLSADGKATMNCYMKAVFVGAFGQESALDEEVAVARANAFMADTAKTKPLADRCKQELGRTKAAAVVQQVPAPQSRPTVASASPPPTKTLAQPVRVAASSKGAAASIAGAPPKATSTRDPNLDVKTFREELKQSELLATQCPPKLVDAVPCFKRLSSAGNRAASETLGKLYADPNSYGVPSGLTRNHAESIRYTLLAIRQHSLLASKFVPDWSYAPQIGMTDMQVKGSQLGEPNEVTSQETAVGVIETWHYDGATLTLSSALFSNKYKILERIDSK